MGCGLVLIGIFSAASCCSSKGEPPFFPKTCQMFCNSKLIKVVSVVLAAAISDNMM